MWVRIIIVLISEGGSVDSELMCISTLLCYFSRVVKDLKEKGDGAGGNGPSLKLCFKHYSLTKLLKILYLFIDYTCYFFKVKLQNKNGTVQAIVIAYIFHPKAFPNQRLEDLCTHH